jgi:hypothetical protein
MFLFLTQWQVGGAIIVCILSSNIIFFWGEGGILEIGFMIRLHAKSFCCPIKYFYFISALVSLLNISQHIGVHHRTKDIFLKMARGQFLHKIETFFSHVFELRSPSLQNFCFSFSTRIRSLYKGKSSRIWFSFI